MLFPDASCRAENTLNIHFQNGLYDLIEADWVAIITITARHKVYIDAYIDINQVGSVLAHRFIDKYKECIYKNNQPTMFMLNSSSLIVVPIRETEVYRVFNFYIKKDAFFSDLDLKWINMYSRLRYQYTLLNNEVVQERDYMENILDSTDSAIVTIDIDGNIKRANNSAKKLFGLRKEDFVGKYCFEYIKVETRGEFIESLNHVISTGKKQFLKNILFINQGAEYILNVVLSPLRDSKNTVVGVVLVGTDITDRRFMEHELEQFRQFSILGEVAAGIVHDVKNPLTNIKGCVKLLSNNKQLNTTQKEVLKIIEHEVARINDVMEQILSFGNVSKQNSFTSISINSIIENCIQVVNRQKTLKEVSFYTKLDPSIPLFKANNSSMQQLIVNILINAVEAITKSGAINILTKQLSNSILIQIEDNGKGMSSSELDSVFMPYYTTKASGTGLGMFLVKRILEQYNGSIEIESSCGIGTKITIIIPIK